VYIFFGPPSLRSSIQVPLENSIIHVVDRLHNLSSFTSKSSGPQKSRRHLHYTKDTIQRTEPHCLSSMLGPAIDTIWANVPVLCSFAPSHHSRWGLFSVKKIFSLELPGNRAQWGSRIPKKFPVKRSGFQPKCHPVLYHYFVGHWALKYGK
jgi:hypothetical protein